MELEKKAKVFVKKLCKKLLSGWVQSAGCHSCYCYQWLQ